MCVLVHACQCASRSYVTERGINKNFTTTFSTILVMITENNLSSESSFSKSYTFDV